MEAIERRFTNVSEDEAVFATLYHMKRLALRDASDPAIRSIAGVIAAGCGEDTLCKAEGGFNHIYRNVSYRFDRDLAVKYLKAESNNDIEFISAPKYLLGNIFEGDCDDMSTSLASLYIAMGLPVNFKVIAWKKRDPKKLLTHVFTEVGIIYDNSFYWVPSDPVFKVFGQEKTPVTRAFIYRVDIPEENIIRKLAG